MTSVMSVETPMSHLDPYSDRALIDPWLHVRRIAGCWPGCLALEVQDVCTDTL